MRGRIIKRKGSNNYTIVLQLGLDPSTGKRKQQWITAGSSKREAEKHMAKLINDLDNGSYIKPDKTTVASYLEGWLKDYVWPSLSPRTAEGYESIVRCHLIPALGSVPLGQLKPEHLQHYYSEKLSGGRFNDKGTLSQTTVSHHHTCIHRAFKMALKSGLISRNPADAVTPPRPQHSEMHTMTEDDLNTFLEATKETPYYVLFYMALFTGMRRSELLALRWSDLDLLLCQVRVTRSLHHLRTGEIVFRATKTAKARRMVSLPPSAALLLQEYKDKQEAQRATLGISLKEDDLVFSNFEGQPLLPDTISHAWTKLVKRTGLKGIRLHDARHTHASLLLKQSVHPKIVQERLGHATISTTLDLYSHISPGLQEAAAIGFDKLINRSEKDAIRK
ncbi:MAG: tyrosine-type recombinase/integrase [Dehalococcoidales bacterium]|nr:tyrosine-type recombinase/integrase [Dehalococcoidales bacterium]